MEDFDINDHWSDGDPDEYQMTTIDQIDLSVTQNSFDLDDETKDGDEINGDDTVDKSERSKTDITKSDSKKSKKSVKSDNKSSVKSSKRHSSTKKNDKSHSGKRKKPEEDVSKSTDDEHSKKKKKHEDTDYDSEYFKRMSNRSKDTFHDPTDKELFLENLLLHVKGKELELSKHKHSSCCIQWIIDHCKSLKTVKSISESINPEKMTADFLKDEYCSSVLETLLEVLVKELSKETNTETTNSKWIIKYIESLAKLFLDNFKSLLDDKTGTRILIVIIEAVGGIQIGRHWTRKNMRFGNGVKLDLKAEVEKDVALKEIPASFRHYLKKICKALVLDATDTEVLEVLFIHYTSIAHYLLFVLKVRYVELCQMVVKRMLEVIFASDSNRDTVAHSASSAYIVEIIMLVASESRLSKIWTKHLKGNLKQFWQHDIANFIIQRLIDAIKEENLFADVCEELFPHLGDIIKMNRGGIAVCLAKKCQEFKKMQSSFVTSMMKAYNCYEPKEKQLDLVPSMLFADLKPRNSKFFIWLQGSLILQCMFTYLDPYKVSKSFLSLSTDDIVRICKDRSGSRAIDSFFQSEKVSTKHKSELVERFLGRYFYLSMDMFGSRVVENIIELSDNNVKRAIMTELSNHETQIKSNRNGNFLARKTGISYFKHKPNDWMKFNNNRMKRRNDFHNGGTFVKQPFMQAKR